MEEIDKIKEEFKKILETFLTIMVSTLALYTPIKDVFEAQNSFSPENIPLIALSTSVILPSIVIFGFAYYYKKKLAAR